VEIGEKLDYQKVFHRQVQSVEGPAHRTKRENRSLSRGLLFRFSKLYPSLAVCIASHGYSSLSPSSRDDRATPRSHTGILRRGFAHANEPLHSNLRRAISISSKRGKSQSQAPEGVLTIQLPHSSVRFVRMSRWIALAVS